MTGTELRTARRVLREWRDSDRAPFAALNADPAVMEFYPSTLTTAESDALVDRIVARFDEGVCLWAVEVPGEAPFIGYVGLAPATFEAHFTPTVEVGWRLAHEYWGRGYAPEAARAAMTDGFGRMALDEIVSFTSALNLRSRRVMEKLGMHCDAADDFDHPSVPEGNRLRRHVLYRLGRSDPVSWRGA